MLKVFTAGSFQTSSEKRNNSPTKQAIYPPAVLHGVIAISRAPRMQSGLDSGTAPQFGNNKGVLPSALRADAFRLKALHIKQTGLSILAQAPCNKVNVAQAEMLRIVTEEFLHWERLTANVTVLSRPQWENVWSLEQSHNSRKMSFCAKQVSSQFDGVFLCLFVF